MRHVPCCSASVGHLSYTVISQASTDAPSRSSKLQRWRLSISKLEEMVKDRTQPHVTLSTVASQGWVSELPPAFQTCCRSIFVARLLSTQQRISKLWACSAAER